MTLSFCDFCGKPQPDRKIIIDPHEQNRIEFSLCSECADRYRKEFLEAIANLLKRYRNKNILE